MSYSVDLDSLTVLATDSRGETTDLNASGEPCADLDDLRAFIAELCTQGAYGASTRDELLAECGE